MYLQSSALQDLCSNYTWPLLLMLLGAWLLGLLFWYAWWLNKRKNYESNIVKYKREIEMQKSKISGLENDVRNILYVKEKAEQDYNSLKAKEGDINQLYKVAQEENENLKLKLQKLVKGQAEDDNPVVDSPLNFQDSNLSGDRESDDNIKEEQDNPIHKVDSENSDESVSDEEEVFSNAESDNAASEGEGKRNGDQSKATNLLLSGFALLERDNLKIVEGIGPKLEKILKDKGISNWEQLAGAKIEFLQSILDEKGPRYKIHNPKTWPEQARLAHTAKWDELIQFQMAFRRRKDGQGMSGMTKVEKTVVKLMGYTQEPSDLKIVEGIGPKIESILKAAGIQNWSDLSQKSPEKIRSILLASDPRYRMHDPSTWPDQAKLARLGNWDALRKLQDKLDGGKA